MREFLLSVLELKHSFIFCHSYDISVINARRIWIVEQFAALLRNGAIPKNDTWVQRVIDWLIVHGLCRVRKKTEKSNFLAVSISAAYYGRTLFSDACCLAARCTITYVF